MEISKDSTITTNTYNINDHNDKKRLIEKNLIANKLNNAINVIFSKSCYIKTNTSSLNTNQDDINLFFHNSKNSFNISVLEYLNRLIRYTEAEISSIIYAFVLLDNISSYIKVDNSNIYLLLITSFVISLKMNEDYVYKNSDYALIGGLSLKKLNKLETVYLQTLNYNVFINNDIVNSYIKFLTKV